MAGVQMLGAGLTATQAREVEISESLVNDIETVINPDSEFSAFDSNRRFEEAKRNSEELSEFEEANIRGNRELLNQQRSNFWNWQKSKLLERKEAGWNTAIRNDRNSQPPKEYDHFLIGFSAEETAFYRDDINRQKKLVEAISAASKSESGQHAVMISKPHFNTANGHVHVLMHRHAVDVNTKSISVGFDLSKRDRANQYLHKLNEELKRREMPQMLDFRLTDGKSTRIDVVNQQAREEVSNKIENSGAIPARDPDALERLKALANTTDAERMSSLAEIARKEAEQKQAQINKLIQEQEEALQRVKLAQEAQSVLMKRDEIKKSIDALELRQTELIEQNTALNAELEQLTQCNQLQEQTIVSLSQNLSSAQNSLEDKDRAIQGLNNDFENLQNELESEQERTHAQMQQIAQLSEKLEIAQASMQKNAALINELSEQRDTLKSENEALRESMNDQKLMMQEMRSMMQEMREQMKSSAIDKERQANADKLVGVIRLDQLQMQVLENKAEQRAKSDFYRQSNEIDDIMGYASQYFGDSRVFFNREGTPAFIDKGNEVFMTSNKKDDLKAVMSYCAEKFPGGFELIGDYSQRRQLEMIAAELNIADKITNHTKQRQQIENAADLANREKVQKMLNKLRSEKGERNAKPAEIQELKNRGINEKLESVIDGASWSSGVLVNDEKTAAVPFRIDNGEIFENYCVGDQREIKRMMQDLSRSYERGRDFDNGRD